MRYLRDVCVSVRLGANPLPQLKVVQRHIFSVQLARSLGEHEDMTVADKLDLVEELKRRLEDGKRYRKERKKPKQLRTLIN